jgi:hypothetical protein
MTESRRYSPVSEPCGAFEADNATQPALAAAVPAVVAVPAAAGPMVGSRSRSPAGTATELRHGRRLQESRMVRRSLNPAEAGPITRRTR